MRSRKRTQKKAQSAPSVTPASTQLQSRPFAPEQQSESSPQNQSPNLEIQRQHAEAVGHNLARISLVPPNPTSPSPIQCKLKIGQVGDQYEQEADRVAQDVVQRMNSSQDQGNENVRQQENSPKLQRQEVEEEELQAKLKPGAVQREAIEDEEELQLKPDSVQRSMIQADFESTLNRAKGGGSPLDNTFRAKVEPTMGADFSRVKIHTDATADQLSQSIQAKAFTTGNDIFFRQGEYDPGSRGGQELVAHELTHVMQQNGNIMQRSPESQVKVGQHQKGGIVSRLGDPMLIQRVLKGVDPLVNYAKGGDKSLLYGISQYRSNTEQRLRQADAQLGQPQPIRTIDLYNKAVGINKVITRSNAAIGIFQVRQALNDKDNWQTHLPEAQTNISTDNDLKAWIQMLVDNKHSIGLYDFGDQKKTGLFGLGKAKGVKLINSRNRFTKNFRSPDKQSAHIKPEDIHSWLAQSYTPNQAQNLIDGMRNNKEFDKVDALNEWIYKAFFRRTSKLGIDFATQKLKANINFNTAGSIDFLSLDANKKRVREDGVALNNKKMDQSKDRAITTSEYRHIKKQIKRGKIAKNKINFYSEF